jgi:hypothetical protein
VIAMNSRPNVRVHRTTHLMSLSRIKLPRDCRSLGRAIALHLRPLLHPEGKKAQQGARANDHGCT